MEVVKKPKKAKVKKDGKTEQRQKSPKAEPLVKKPEEPSLAGVIVDAAKQEEVKKNLPQQQKPESVKMLQKKRIKSPEAVADIKKVEQKDGR